MAIQFPCPHCRQLLVLDASRAGQSIHCPACREDVTVPLMGVPVGKAVAEPAPVPDEPSDVPTARLAEAPAAPTPTPAAPTGGGWSCLALGVLLVGALVGVTGLVAGGVVVCLALVQQHSLPPPGNEVVSQAGENGNRNGPPAGLDEVPQVGSTPPAAPERADPPVPTSSPRKEIAPPARDAAREPEVAPDGPKPPEKPAPPAREEPAGGKGVSAPPAVTVKRRDTSEDEDLRKQLLLAPEVALDTVPATSAGLLQVASRLQANGLYPGPVLLRAQRPDLAGLPLRMGLDCQLGKEPAEDLQALSRKLRVHLEAAIPKGTGDPRPDPDLLRAELLEGKDRAWVRPEAVPALLQLLQAENRPVRGVLVDLLAQIPGKRATAALAVRALVDLSAEVREAAVRALRDRPREEYEPLLLSGFLYPWSPVADHAAEALVALRDRDAVPGLVKVLEAPDPNRCFTVREGKKDVPAVQELVRVNHLANCMLCHPPSFARTDLVRGAVPTPGQPLPAPASATAYYERGGPFVHADVTYLRQDFSVMQTVAQPGAWPANQRYDYLVRVRRATPQEQKQFAQARATSPGPQRQAVLFALRELTGKDQGVTADDWKRALPESRALRSLEDLTAADTGQDWGQFLSADRVAVDPVGRADADRLRAEVLAAPGEQQKALLDRLRDGKGAAYTDALAGAAPRLTGAAQRQARDALVQRLTRMTSTTLRDKLQDDDAEVRRAAALACAMKDARGQVPDLISLLRDPEPAVAQAAGTALKSLTGQDLGPGPDAGAEERLKAAGAWAAWWKKQIGS
jgi:HEAT repeat protein